MTASRPAVSWSSREGISLVVPEFELAPEFDEAYDFTVFTLLSDIVWVHSFGPSGILGAALDISTGGYVYEASSTN